MKDRIKTLWKNKDIKLLVENFFSLSLLNLASYVFPLLTLPYLARVIGVDKFGDIAFASAIIVYFQTIVDWGYSFTATRDIAKNRENIAKVKIIFNTVMWSKIFLVLVSFIILIVLVIFIPFLNKKADIILVSFLLILGHVMFPEWLFQGLEKMKFITIFNILSKLIFTGAVFLFINKKEDYIFQPLFISLGYIMAGVISLILINKKWGIKLSYPNLSMIIISLKSSFDVFVNQITPNLYNSFSTLLLGFFGGNVAVGKLDGGTKFLSIGQQFMTVISKVFFPFLSRKIEKHSLYAKYSLMLAFVLSLGLFFLAPLIIKLFFTNEFEDSINVLRILSFSIFFLSLENVFGTNYMIIQGHEKELRNITFNVSILGFLIAIPLVFYFSFIGAALTIFISRALLGIVIMYKAKTLKNKL